MAKKKTKMAPPSRIAANDPQGGVLVTLPEAVIADCDVMRWLHHWVVDAISDRGYAKWIEVLVESHLVELGPDIVDTTVSDLVRQAQAATSKRKEPKKPKASKKGAKRKRKRR